MKKNLVWPVNFFTNVIYLIRWGAMYCRLVYVYKELNKITSRTHSHTCAPPSPPPPPTSTTTPLHSHHHAPPPLTTTTPPPPHTHTPNSPPHTHTRAHATGRVGESTSVLNYQLIWLTIVYKKASLHCLLESDYKGVAILCPLQWDFTTR